MTSGGENLVSALVDTRILADWMDQQGLEKGAISDVQRLAGGTQNVVLKFSKGGRSFVMRRPPPNPRAESNETMRREARVLAALKGTNAPHPGLIAACGDESVLGVAFYLMEAIDGFNATSGRLPAPFDNDPNLRRQMGFSVVDSVAALGAIDYIQVGLEGFGKPANYLNRQVDRWRGQLESYSRYEGWPGAETLPGVKDVIAYLEKNTPTDFKPGIIHGDYSIGNVMFRYDRPQVAAIIDWELATIGDPLLDLGWLLATWRNVPPVDLPVLVVEPWNGFPEADELIQRYAAQSERDLSNIDWYAVLACYKLAILLEGTYARACAGLDPMEAGQSLHDSACKLFQRALYRIQA